MTIKQETEFLRMKYSLTKNSIEIDGRKLYQIKAEMSFGNVKKGDLGGYKVE